MIISLVTLITHTCVSLRRSAQVFTDRLSWVVAVLMMFGVLTFEIGFAHAGEREDQTRQVTAPSSAQETQAPVSITITPEQTGQPRTFRVVLICDRAGSRAKGLQGFRQLEPGEAALFLFERAESVSFWMGSVSYPIDIVFVGLDREVARVYPHCKPGSLEHYPSIVPVKWVIETAAGSGIRPGDSVKISSK